MKLSEQKQIYSERIKVIWKRQIASLSAPGDRSLDAAVVDGDADDAVGTEAQKKTAEAENDDSEDDSGDEFAAELEGAFPPLFFFVLSRFVANHIRHH